MPTIYSLIKLFDCREHAEAFVNGKLFMNTVSYFREFQDKNGELRGDSYEGIQAIFQPDRKGSLRIGLATIPNKDIAGPILMYSNRVLQSNAFCCYSVNSGSFTTLSEEILEEFKRTLMMHRSCFGLGDHCVLIVNSQEFISRCTTAIRKAHLDGKLGLVDYYDASVDSHAKTSVFGLKIPR